MSAGFWNTTVDIETSYGLYDIWKREPLQAFDLEMDSYAMPATSHTTPA